MLFYFVFRQRYWQFEVSNELPGCKPFHPPDVNMSTCLFYFSVCTPVPDFCPENSGICLSNKVKYGPPYNDTLYSKQINIGSFKEDGKRFIAGLLELKHNLCSVFSVSRLPVHVHVSKDLH